MNTIAEHIHSIALEWYERPLFAAQDGRVNYGETRHIMLQTAHWLINHHGIQPRQQVAICLPMGLTATHMALGVLAAGASFLPLQNLGPIERLIEIVSDSEVRVLLTTAVMARRFGPVMSERGPVKIVIVDENFNAFRTCLSQSLDAPIVASPEELAAVFFTSGSTGQPKGVQMSRRSMTKTLNALATGIDLFADDRMFTAAPLHYAASITVFAPIFFGCSTYIASEQEAMFADVTAEILEREHTTVWEGAAARVKQVVNSEHIVTHKFDALRYVGFFGEPMPVATLQSATKIFRNAIFHNTYGSSEAFWMAEYVVRDTNFAGMDVLPLGKPLSRYQFDLYDEKGSPVPEGEVGEICVVGPVALTGYWKRPDLTATVRLNGIPNSYRTGDLARLGQDGNYYFVGRKDHQVKIHGHRFELGEIEATLKSHSKVREAVAFLVNEAIHCFVQSEDDANHILELNAICAKRLPAFARPKKIVVLNEFPRLSSGKIDRLGLRKHLTDS